MNNIHQLIFVMGMGRASYAVGTQYLWKCIESIPQKKKKITIFHSGNSYRREINSSFSFFVKLIYV